MKSPHSAPRAAWLVHAIVAAVLVTLVTFAVRQFSIGLSVRDIPGIGSAVVLVITLGVGWLLATRLPRHPLGWLLIAVPGLFALTVAAELLGRAVQPFTPGLTAWLYWYGFDRDDGWSWLPPVGLLFTQVPLLFPNGRLPSRGWRWFSGFTIVSIAAGCAVFSTLSVELAPGVPNPVHSPVVSSEEWIQIVVLGFLATSIVGSVASLFVRYGRADSLQRTQIRWVLWGISISVATLVLSWLLPGELEFIQNTVVFSYALIPIAILFAVLRYRLYEIDRIISRTTSYALVSVVVVGVYLLVVTSVTWLLPGLPSVGVALATLAAAALFLPVLHVVRRSVDRRFDRERYDAERVVEAFGERLRTEVDPHSSAEELVHAVEKTLQPAVIGVWVPGDVRLQVG